MQDDILNLMISGYKQISVFDIEEEKEQTKKYTLYGPLFETGFTGQNVYNGVQDLIYFYPTKEVNDVSPTFVGKPVDFMHDNNPIGIVKKVLYNENGYTTKSGRHIQADDLWHCEIDVELPLKIDINNYAFSVEIDADRVVCENGMYNSTPCDYTLRNIKAKYVSIVEKDSARFTASKNIKNSINKDIDNKKNPFQEEDIKFDSFMQNEEIIKKIVEPITNSIDELKDEVKNSKKIKNQQEEKEDKEDEVKNSTDEKYDEIKNLIKNAFDKMDEKIENFIKNSIKNQEDTKEEKEKEEGIKNSVDKIDTKQQSKQSDVFSIYNDDIF
jgi:hypothetical protein